MITGERVVSSSNGWGPTWYRHVAAYRECAAFLPAGRVLDLGCGVGHSYELLAPRESVGVDLDPAALAGQRRETVTADMRSLPFANGSFASVLSVHSLEHVPDPERVVGEAARVLGPGGVAVFVTPNRLTFGRPDEIIDPYHYIEYDAAQLARLISDRFEEVTVHGLFGSPRVLALLASQDRVLTQVLALDPWGIGARVPRRVRQRLYDLGLTLTRRRPDPRAEAISEEDYSIGDENLDIALDLVAVAHTPRP